MIGLTRQAARPVRANADVQSSATTARRARTAHTAQISATAAAHTARSGSPRRARMPWTDWFET